MTASYTVTGMTCDHCANAVRTEVGGIAGVTGVDVDVATGSVVVHGDGFTDDQVGTAVTEAGYALS